MATLAEKFRGCLLGGAIGDMIGAAVEAESPEYIARTYRSIDDILSTRSVAEFSGPDWKVGRFTDDTQMTVCVAEWLIADRDHSPEKLLARFAKAYEPSRRYGSGTEGILRLYTEHPAQWRELATAMFPYGSFGNGGAMRVAPIALAYCDDLKKVAAVALESSRPTHCHSLAYQGAVWQSIAVAMAARMSEIVASEILKALRSSLVYFSDLMQDTSKFSRAIDSIEQGLGRGASCAEMAKSLGTGIAVYEAVPMAIYCFLRHPESYNDVINQSIYIGGDTDTIGCMAGAIAGAFLGIQAIPRRWVDAVRDEKYPPETIENLADRLFAAYLTGE